MESAKTSIILAAGRGSRLKELSLENPKPMTTVQNQTIISNLISHLINNDLRKIVVVVGYMAEKLKQHVTDHFMDQAEIIFVENDIFDKTNNIYSLFLAEKYLSDGFYLFEADVFCENPLIKRLTDCPSEDIILIDRWQSPMEGTVVAVDDKDTVTAMYLKRNQHEGFDFKEKYKTINFYRIGKQFANHFFIDKLKQHIASQDVNSYYELIIKEAVDNGYQFHGLSAEGLKWWEIDTYEDLQLAENIFNDM